MYRRFFKRLPQSKTRQKRRSDSPKKNSSRQSLTVSLFRFQSPKSWEPPNPRFWFFDPFQRATCPHCQSAFWSNVWFDSELFRRVDDSAEDWNKQPMNEISSFGAFWENWLMRFRGWIRNFGFECLDDLFHGLFLVGLDAFTSFSRSDWWVWLLFFGVCFEGVIGGVRGRKRWTAEDLVCEMGSLSEISPDLDKLDGQISDIFRALS